MITNRGALQPGVALYSKHKGEDHLAVVAADGYIELEDGQRFKSPSGAAAAAAGLKAVNGWAFWSLVDATLDTAEAGDKPVAIEKAAPPERKEETPSERRARLIRSYDPIKRQPGGRYFCDGCMHAFTPAEDDPTGESSCPNGCVRSDLRRIALSLDIEEEAVA